MTWHEDGRSWHRFAGQIAIKKASQPLSSFEGAETLSILVVPLLKMTPEDREDRPEMIGPDDVVFAFEGPFAVEMILSHAPVVLPNLASRLNPVIHERATPMPIITLEGFQLADKMFPTDRFPPARTHEEGKDLFFSNTGRLP